VEGERRLQSRPGRFLAVEPQVDIVIAVQDIHGSRFIGDRWRDPQSSLW
jgi:hypothetical protein